MAVEQHAPGRRVLRRGAADRGIALLWHGRGIDGADWMVPLAERVAAAGVLALAVDWSSEGADHGRADLFSSVELARSLATDHRLDPDALVVAGWSLGGTAAVGLALHAARLGLGLGGVVLIAPGDGPYVMDAISGSPLPTTMPPGAGRARIDLVYGERDTSATPDLVTGLELRLRVAGWRTGLHEVDTDHAGIVGTRFDPRTEQYLPSKAGHAVRAADTVAALIARAATSSS